MKPYGLPRWICIEYPDVADIQEFAMKSCIGKLITKSGEYKSYIRSTTNRNNTRRLYKKRARRLAIKYIINSIGEYNESSSIRQPT